MKALDARRVTCHDAVGDSDGRRGSKSVGLCQSLRALVRVSMRGEKYGKDGLPKAPCAWVQMRSRNLRPDEMVVVPWLETVKVIN